METAKPAQERPNQVQDKTEKVSEKRTLGDSKGSAKKSRRVSNCFG